MVENYKKILKNNREIKKAMILAGGLGTRFLPITLSLAKELVPIGNNPILMYHLVELYKAGVRDVLIVGNKLKEDSFNNFRYPSQDYVDKVVKDNKYSLLSEYFSVLSLMKISYINQDEAVQNLNGKIYRNPYYKERGSSIAILAGVNWSDGEPFLVINGDDLLVYDDGKSPSSELVAIFEATGDNVIYGRECDRELMYKYSSMECGEDVADGKGKKMTNIVEKPAPGTEPSNIMGFGRYIVTNDFMKNVFNVKPRGNGEWNMTDVFQKLANDGLASTCLFKGRYFDCGNTGGYVLANLYFGSQNPEYREQICEGAKDIIDLPIFNEESPLKVDAPDLDDSIQNCVINESLITQNSTESFLC